MVIASDWGEKNARAATAVNRGEVSESGCGVPADFVRSWVDVDLLFSVKIFLNDNENKIQIFACRFRNPFLVSSRWQGANSLDVNNM